MAKNVKKSITINSNENEKNVPLRSRYHLIVNLIFTAIIFFVLINAVVRNSTGGRDSFGFDSDITQYSGDWYVENADGSLKQVEVPGVVEGVKVGESYSYITVLPEVEDNTYLTLANYKQTLEIFIDDESRASFNFQGSSSFGTVEPAAYFTIALNSKDSGKTLRIVANSYANSSLGRIGEIYYGSQMSVVWYLLHMEAFKIVIAFIIVTLGLLSILASFLIKLIFKTDTELLYLAVGVTLAGFWELTNSPLRIFIFPDLLVSSDSAFLMILLMPPFFLSYIDAVQKHRYGLINKIMVTVSLITCVTCIFLHIFKLNDYTNLMPVIGVMCVSLMVFLFVTVVIDGIRGYIRSQFLVAIGLAALFICGIIEMMAYFDSAFNSGGIVLEFGIGVLLICAVANAVKKIIENDKEKQKAILAKETRGKFLANMSHEIRTPINSILGFNTVILRECEDQEILKYATDIQSAGQSLLSIINDILDFSKIESGKMELFETEYEIAKIVHDVYSMIKLKAENKGLVLHCDIDPNLPKKLWGDEVRIKQILVNLLNNAVKYTDEGTIWLTISGNAKDDIESIYFSVKDTGAGIEEANLEKLFAEFGRIESEANHHKEGTGLGISITSNLVHLMGSELKVESTIGKGSNFYFTLEEKIIDATPIGSFNGEANKKVEKQKYQTKYIAPTAKLLVVDDNSMNRNVLKALLKTTKIQIDEAEDGYKCIEMAKENKYDLIFLDYMMPGMDGRETLQRMKKIQDFINCDTPVVVLTANATTGVKEEYLEQGFNDYLSKPVKPIDLEEMLWKYISDDKKVEK